MGGGGGGGFVRIGEVLDKSPNSPVGVSGGNFDLCLEPGLVAFLPLSFLGMEPSILMPNALQNLSVSMISIWVICQWKKWQLGTKSGEKLRAWEFEIRQTRYMQG